MNAFFEFTKWLIKFSLAVCAIILTAIVAFIFGFMAKRRANKEVSDD